MRAFTSEDGKVANVAKFDDGADLPAGWTEAKNGEQVGWVADGGGFVAPAVSPPVPLTVLERILQLERTATPRRMREAAIGDVDATQWLKNLELQIAALRRLEAL